MRTPAPCLLLALVLLTPSAAAAGPLLPLVYDDHIGVVRGEIAIANETYGSRAEFDLARLELARAGAALVIGASLVTEDNLAKSVGALETGRARAQAMGTTDPLDHVLDHAADLAGEAEALTQRIRFDLRTMERAGLEPVALDGGLAVARLTLRSLDMLNQYRVNVNAWEQGHQTPEVEIAIVNTAAAALRFAEMAGDLLAAVARARADAPVTQLLGHDALDGLAGARVAWSDAHRAPATLLSQSRLFAVAEGDEHLLTLGAYLLWFQDLSFNGLLMSARSEGKSVDAPREAWLLVNETAPGIRAWVSALDVPGDQPLGAIESAEFVLAATGDASGLPRHKAGAYAASVTHLALEHAGLLQEAYGGVDHVPGDELSTASVEPRDAGRSMPAWLPLAAAAVFAAAAVGLLVWRIRK